MVKKYASQQIRKIKRSHLEIINYLMDSRHSIEIQELTYDAVKLSSQKFQQILGELFDIYNKFITLQNKGFFLTVCANLFLVLEIYIRSIIKIIFLGGQFLYVFGKNKLAPVIKQIQLSYLIHKPERHKALVVASFSAICIVICMLSTFVGSSLLALQNDNSSHFPVQQKDMQSERIETNNSQDLITSYLENGKLESIVQDTNRISFVADVKQVSTASPKESIFIMQQIKKRHKITSSENLLYIIKKYKVSLVDLIKENPDIDLSSVKAGEIIIIPDKIDINYALHIDKYISQVAPKYRLTSFASSTNSSGYTKNLSLYWPIPYSRNVSSGFGWRGGSMHRGIDILAPVGTQVNASKTGIIKFSGWAGGYGNCVVIDHGMGVTTRYAHLAHSVVQAGQIVEAGQIIAFSGNTGSSTGPHLHYEVMVNEQPRNPLSYFEVSSHS